MILDCKQFAGACACGKAHELTTRLAVIEAGCLRDFNTHLNTLGIAERRAAIYDSNTLQAKGLTRLPVAQEIVLQAEGLRADERAIGEVLRALDAGTEVLIAVGSGTIHDIVRYCAHKLGIPFVSCPTAASTTGFCAKTCRMVWQGKPAVLPGVAPVLVLADVDVLRQAPRRLAGAGIGDMLGKTVALADAQIAARLAGEADCPKAEAMAHQAFTLAQGCCGRLAGGDADAFAQLLYGQLLYGLSTQMEDDKPPQANAAEQLAALMDLLPDQFGAKEDALHGDIIGVWAVSLSGLYHRVAEINEVAPCIKPFKPLDEAFLSRHFGGLAPALTQVNAKDCLSRISPQQLVRQWQEIRRAVAEIPTNDELAALLSSVGAPVTPEAIGVSSASQTSMMRLAPCLQNRVTLLRLLRLLSFRYPSSAETTRSKSRGSRYADKSILRAGKSTAVSAL